MWITRLSVKLFACYAVLNLSLAVAYVSWVANWQRDIVMQQVEGRLFDTARVLRDYVAAELERGGPEQCQPIVTRLAAGFHSRLTVVAPDGRVWADSHEDPAVMENHAGREELQQALAGPVGKSLRFSPTLREKMLYVALPVQRDGRAQALVRVALPLSAIDRQVGRLHSLLWWLAGGVGLAALLLTFLVTRRIIRPLRELKDSTEAIAAGQYDRRIPKIANDELGTLGRAIEHMRRELTRQLSELRENTQQLETVLGSMVEGVLAVNAEQRVLLANEASRRLLGIETPEVVGRPLLEVTRHRAVREAVSKAMESVAPCELEFETLGVQRRWLAMRVARLPGTPCPGAVAVLHDISELRRLENVRREFVANVSHELKTPLASIKAYAETLRLGALHDTEHNLQFVERIEEQAERLHQLILDLLHLARVESGKEAFNIRVLSLAEVVEASLPDYRERAEAKGLQLDADLAEEPVFVAADESGLLVILDNLVTNAIQYTPAGGRVTIRVRLDAARAILEVEDTGVGIAPRDQQRIFERFYRVDKGRSRELGGTGLGLAIVKHLTQAFGGAVSLHSEPGRGSTFQIALPPAGDGAAQRR